MQPSDSDEENSGPKFGPENAHEFGPSELSSELSDFYVRRLQEAIGAGTVAEFARRSRIAHSTLAAVLEKRSLPRWETAVKIARAASRSLDWFAPSEWLETIQHVAENLEDVTYQVGRTLTRNTELGSFCFIPLYDVRASAGHGAWNDAERVSKQLAFRREWISTELRARPEDLVLIYIDGDSMEPTLSDGDVVMVDRSQLEVHSDSIYVFTQDGALLVKRLQRLPGGRISVISDNDRFGRYEMMPASDAASRMIGRVVWGGIRL